MSYMFINCNTLISLSFKNGARIKNLNIQIYITNINSMFYGCKSLISLPDIFKFDISNAKNISNMFSLCHPSFQDVSNWNTANAINMKSNLSKANLSEVNNMNYKYNGPYSSVKLPDFYLLYLYQNYITFELTYKADLFHNNIYDLLNMEFIEKNKDKFIILYNGYKLELNHNFVNIENNHKDIIKFTLCLDKNINDLSHMFEHCYSLISVEDYTINNGAYETNEEFKSIFSDSMINYSSISNNNTNNYLNLIKEIKSGLSVSSNINNTKILTKNRNYQLNYQLSLIDMGSMFYKCRSLISLPDISKWNTANVNNMERMFYECRSLISLPDISKWNTANVNNMGSMYLGCKLTLYINFLFKYAIIFELTYKKNQREAHKVRILNEKFIKNNRNNGGIIYNNFEFELNEFFDNIDKHYNNNDIIKILLYLNKNIDNMSYLFAECKSLISIKRIYKIDCYSWNNESNQKNEEFQSMFYEISDKNSNLNDKSISDNFYSLCKESIHNFSKNSTTNNITTNQEKTQINFAGGDIQNLNISHVKNMSYMFYECNSLVSLPDISNWNISNANNMSFMFYGCKSLISLPDISKWDTSNIIDMKRIFYGCNSLILLPDISNWNTSNVENMEFMFYGCKSLLLLPDISKWNTSKVNTLFLNRSNTN